jgi:hypothetical protein
VILVWRRTDRWEEALGRGVFWGNGSSEGMRGYGKSSGARRRDGRNRKRGIMVDEQGRERWTYRDITAVGSLWPGMGVDLEKRSPSRVERVDGRRVAGRTW